MVNLTFGPYTFDHDAQATRTAYAAIAGGGADTCACALCRNWVAIRERVLPAAFFELLERLGVDYRKDAEVVHYGRQDNGLHYYDGWYHAVGELLDLRGNPAVAFDGVEIQISRSLGYDVFFEELRGFPLICISFAGHFPWALEGEKEPE